MGWWKERKEQRNAHLVATLTEALGQALGRVFEAQSKQIEQSSHFLDQLQDLSARKAAQIMGSRGGRRTQARKRSETRQLREPQCRLCRDPYDKHFTVEQYNAHLLHSQPEQIEGQTETAPEVAN
jgi:hypothetical protein